MSPRIWNLIARRILLAGLMLLLVSLVMFALMHAVPGDPIDAIIGDRQAGQAEIREQYEALFGLDEPVLVQYLYYLKNLARGDLGISIVSGEPVADELRRSMPATFELALISMSLTLIAGIPLGVLSALRKDRWPDMAARWIAVGGASMPVFWMALLASYLFTYRLRWLPRSGQLDVGMAEPARVTGFLSVDALLAGDFDVFTSFLRHVILPATILAIFSVGIVTRMLRSSLLAALSDDYVRTARAKGLPERTVVYRHALRNALIPTVTVIGLTFSSLLTGAAIVETIYSWPGLGQMAVRMALNFDYPGMIGATLAIATIYIVVSMLVDLTYTLLDPRIRVG
jgi:peptide/nickel transport system permease protein